MKTVRTIILLAGILVAGLALNTTLAQSSEKGKPAVRDQHNTINANKPLEPGTDRAIEKSELKSQKTDRIPVVKTQKIRQKVMTQQEQKVKNKP
jgi:hypothetical protein